MSIRDWFARRKLRGDKDSLKRMFFVRAERFTNDTMDILKRMPNALQAIVEFIHSKAAFTANGEIEFTDISLLDAGSEDPVVLMVGTMHFRPGVEVELKNGDKTVVTPDTEEYFKKMVRFGIPLRLVESSPAEILKYLKESDEERQEHVEEIKKAVEEALGIEPDEKVTKQTDTVTTDADFDLTQLTEEQRRQLSLLSRTGRG